MLVSHSAQSGLSCLEPSCLRTLHPEERNPQLAKQYLRLSEYSCIYFVPVDSKLISIGIKPQMLNILCNVKLPK